MSMARQGINRGLALKPQVLASPPPRYRSRFPWRRGLVVLTFVGIWMIVGWWFKLDVNQYLLVGVPLTVLFQLVVRRQPIRALWVRDAPPLRIGPMWLVLTGAVATLPAYALYRWVRPWDGEMIYLLVVAILGAPAAGYGLRHLRYRAVVAAGLVVIATVWVTMPVLIMMGALNNQRLAMLDEATVYVVLKWSLIYFPLCFIVEEVTFRGALDSYLWKRGELGVCSALALSFLWGLWHLPIQHVPINSWVVLWLGVVHTAIGVPLTMSWRFGGNLAIPAAIHTLLDGLRNVAAGG
jgi:Type II CAAX prenyl endopeptidase Rce1-like